jgi:hypothetical protein
MTPVIDREQYATEKANDLLTLLCDRLTAEARWRAEEAVWLQREGRWWDGVGLEGEARGLLAAAKLALEKLRS